MDPNLNVKIIHHDTKHSLIKEPKALSSFRVERRVVFRVKETHDGLTRLHSRRIL